MQNNKRALVIGCTGQDGSYLCELLKEKGYEVHGMVRVSSSFNRSRIEHIFDTDEKREKYLHYGDLTDIFSILHILKEVQPDEIYNLGAQSHVGISWKVPFYTAQITGVGVLNLLEAIRFLELKSKIYNAATSELFSGDPSEAPQNEETRMNPQSPYGSAKLYAYQICKNYREAYNMFICNGILFNHESARRGDNFVTKKIIDAIPTGEVHLGNIDASRDWGWAKEYVEGMWLMLQQDKPDDYILATGETHTIKEFIGWVEEITGKPMKVIIDNRFVRPQDVLLLCGNPTKAKEKLGWSAITKGKELVKKMIC